MTTGELVALVTRAFPPVPRPAPDDIPAHTDGCAHCELMLRDLLKYPGPELPAEAIRYLCDEMSTLSAKATAWVLPSYLRYVLTEEDERDPRPTEFLIYNLRPRPEYADEARDRMSLLTVAQIGALQALVRHLRQGPRWAEYYGDDLDQATNFLAGLLEVARPADLGTT